MISSIDERLVVIANARTVGVVVTLGDVEIAVKMPSPPGLAKMNEERARQIALSQLRLALEAARLELADG